MANSLPAPLAAASETAASGSVAHSLGLLVLRLVSGGFMLYLHGWGKLQGLLAGAEGFPDPLGVGSYASASLAVFAEVFAAALLVVGLFTRLAAVPLIITMLVAAFLLHGADPLDVKESALVYLTFYVAIAALGPGAWSLDAKLFGRG